MRLAITRPMDQAKKLIMALFATPIMRLEESANHLEKQVIAWDTKVKQEAAAAQKKLDDEAERKRQALLKKADAAPTEEKRAKFLDKADAVVAPIVTADLPQVRGSSIARRWAWRMKDEAKLTRSYLKADETKIGKLVRSAGPDALKLIGEGSIEIYEDKSVRSW